MTGRCAKASDNCFLRISCDPAVLKPSISCYSTLDMRDRLGFGPFTWLFPSSDAWCTNTRPPIFAADGQNTFMDPQMRLPSSLTSSITHWMTRNASVHIAMSRKEIVLILEIAVLLLRYTNVRNSNLVADLWMQW